MEAAVLDFLGEAAALDFLDPAFLDFFAAFIAFEHAAFLGQCLFSPAFTAFAFHSAAFAFHSAAFHSAAKAFDHFGHFTRAIRQNLFNIERDGCPNLFNIERDGCPKNENGCRLQLLLLLLLHVVLVVIVTSTGYCCYYYYY